MLYLQTSFLSHFDYIRCLFFFFEAVQRYQGAERAWCAFYSFDSYSFICICSYIYWRSLCKLWRSLYYRISRHLTSWWSLMSGRRWQWIRQTESDSDQNRRCAARVFGEHKNAFLSYAKYKPTKNNLT